MTTVTLSSLVDKIKQGQTSHLTISTNVCYYIYPICFIFQWETLASSMSKVEMVNIYYYIQARYSRPQIFVVVVIVVVG